MDQNLKQAAKKERIKKKRILRLPLWKLVYAGLQLPSPSLYGPERKRKGKGNVRVLVGFSLFAGDGSAKGSVRGFDRFIEVGWSVTEPYEASL